MSNARAITAALVALAVLFLLISLFYFTQKTSLLASSNTIHDKHAFLFLGLAVLSLIGANVARRRGESGGAMGAKR